MRTAKGENMKEHPILFSTEMVKAILEGRKTQTRRALRPQVLDILPMKVPDEWVALTEVNPNHGKVIKCRFGQVGDRLWVREAFCNLCPDDQGFCYKADKEHNPASDLCAAEWKPSSFMPRWASRITLEITGIRVERVQEISQADAVAEGLLFLGGMADNWDDAPWADPTDIEQTPYKYPSAAYGHLWDSINGKKYPWSSNPWCWCIEFKR
jgi:hypothetical protein